MKDASNPMSCRGVNLLRNSLLALCLAVTSAAQAGSLDEFNTALDDKGSTPEVRESRAASFAAALAEDIIDQQLTIQQRTSALYGEALDDAFLKHYGQAIDEFTVLIDGSDSRIGPLSTDSFYYTAALEWRAHCLAETGDLGSALKDIDKAAEIRPFNWTIKRMQDDIHDKLKKPNS